MIDADAYAVTDKPKFDESTENFQYVVFYPTQGSDINGFSDLRIHICGKEYWYFPSEAYLTIKGVLKKNADDTSYTGDELISMCNFGPLFLFSKLTYRIGDRDIESIDNPGQILSMMGHTLFTDSFKDSDGLSSCWSPDTNIEVDLEKNKGFKARHELLFTDTTKKGSFTFRIPLKYLFGFCFDYDRCVWGYNHCLSLVRQNDYFSLIRKNAQVALGKVDLKAITLHMPILTPSTIMRVRLLEVMKSKTPININYRERRAISIDIPTGLSVFDWQISTISLPKRPKFVMMTFQHDNKTDQTSNYGLFENENVSTIAISVNNWRYSLHEQVPATWEDYDIQEFYRSFLNTRERLFGIDGLINTSHVSPQKYRKLFPIFTFDLSRHKEEILDQTVTTIIHIRFKKALEKSTRCHVLMISDTEAILNTEGGSVVVL